MGVGGADGLAPRRGGEAMYTGTLRVERHCAGGGGYVYGDVHILAIRMSDC